MAKRKSEAFDIRESGIKSPYGWNSYADIAQWLENELTLADEARSMSKADIKYGWTLYEQGRTRNSRNSPWPDAADLTSPLAAEYVDTMLANWMDTVLTEPVWTVEGFGDSASRAPFVEEFHQKAQEDERLQGYLYEVGLRMFIEPAGVLEISEAFEMRRETARKRVALQLDEATQTPVMGEDGQPLLARNPETQDYLEPPDEMTPSAEVDVDEWQPVRLGPEYDVVPYLDFVTLPHHARNRSQIWGYAKRFHRRVPELKARAKFGHYDAKAVESIGDENERHETTEDGPDARLIVSQQGPTAQKELWEVQFLADLDGQGERWWRATLHKDKRVLLRLKHDDRTTRYIRFVPFPKPGSVDGYSLVTNKMITVIEEDTAVRNMWADSAAMAIARPIKRRTGALWNPFTDPMGPRSVIEVRDPAEVEIMQVQDVPQSMIHWRRAVRDDAERLIGQNDTSLGVQTEERRTLGEVQLTAGYAAKRTNLVIKNLQESMEELAQARHTIWKRVLQGKSQGLPMKQSLVMGLEARGIDADTIATDGRITAQMLEGQFWFKPRASVESADKNRQRQLWVSFMQALPGIAGMSPAAQQLFASIPVVKSLIEQMLRVFDVEDKQPFLGSEAQQIFQQAEMMASPQMQMLMQMAQSAPGMGGNAPNPGMAEGAPPQGGAGMVQ